MRKTFGIILGMLGMIVLAQSGLAFFNVSQVVNGLQAGISLLAFGITLFIIGALMVKPKGDDC